MNLLGVLLLVLPALGYDFPQPCTYAVNAKNPFCDTSLSIDERVDNLVSLIPEEQYIYLFGNAAYEVNATNLYIPSYQWWSEALHGVAGSPGVTFTGNTSAATSFPQVCTTAASFNRDLFSQIASTIGMEARSMNNLGRAGMTFWAPNINIYRDPRWGRGQETPGEDPYLTSVYAMHFVRGMQNSSVDPKHLQVSSCCKHFTAYDVENWGGTYRSYFDAEVSQRDLFGTFLVPFEACYHQNGGAASGMMCSYNAVNGVPMCANGDLINGLAREKWGFDGYVTSDCGAAMDAYTAHHYTKTPQEAVADELHAGMDVDCGVFVPLFINSTLAKGLVTLETVQTALRHQFRVLFRLGYFDPLDAQPFTMYNADNVDTDQARQLALDAAREGVVMLSFDSTAMPLDNRTVRKVAVLGPNANNSTVQLGNYYGTPPYIITVTEGIQEYADVDYVHGCDVQDMNISYFDEACDAAKKADAVVLVMGNDQNIEAEAHDRTSIRFYGLQELFIRTVAKCSPTPIIVVVMSGGSVDYTAITKLRNVRALMWAGYPGQSGGKAIADIIFGTVSPSGRLPHTVYPGDYVNQVSMLDMQMEANATTGNPGRTYRFYTGTPVFPFGHGLTYTTFTVKPIHKSHDHTSLVAGGSTRLSVAHIDVARSLSVTTSIGSIALNVTNVGAMRSKYSVLLFVKHVPTGSDVGGALSDFVKVDLAPGKSTVIELHVHLHAVLHFPGGVRSVRHGKYTWHVEDLVGTFEL